jgi:secreted PhoX family phosphatase
MRLRTLMPLLMAVACTNDGSNPTSSIGEDLIGSGPFGFHPVAAVAKAPGVTSQTSLPPEFIQFVVAQGSNPLENPATVDLGDGATTTVTHYGYDGDGPLLPAPGDLPSATHKIEASKTEPDKNTYLVLFGQTGADPTYDYGTHFLYQGHETGTAGYLTRINLDADAAHRVTVMASRDKNGGRLPLIDGSTWDPFAQRLLFTSENGAKGGVWQATLGFPSVVEDISGAMGRGGYEAVQNDSAGNVWLVEDVGGASPAAAPHAKVPNSFVYRFVPRRPDDLTRGKLQVLQVTSLQNGQPISFHGADVDTLSPDVADLHSYGKTFDTRWITIHDTEVDGSTPFDANALAKKLLGTPFKRPENGQFRPGSGFKDFFFDETGDTSSLTEAGSGFGGFGGVFKLTQSSPRAGTGTLTLFYLGDLAHTGFDNVTFISRDHLVFVEDGGDTLHTQRNALDSGYLFDVTADYSSPANQPARLIGEGRDPSATIDSGFLGMPGFQNEGDNEITGIHMSNGDPSPSGILGAAIPRRFKGGWRLFYTQQHGDNATWEILPSAAAPPLLDD